MCTYVFSYSPLSFIFTHLFNLFIFFFPPCSSLHILAHSSGQVYIYSIYEQQEHLKPHTHTCTYTLTHTNRNSVVQFASLTAGRHRRHVRSMTVAVLVCCTHRQRVTEHSSPPSFWSLPLIMSKCDDAVILLDHRSERQKRQSERKRNTTLPLMILFILCLQILIFSGLLVLRTASVAEEKDTESCITS